MNNSDIIKKLRDREYMSGTTRTSQRIAKSGEVFTPDWLVDEMVSQLADSCDIFSDDFIFRDSSCGDGQLLAGVMIKLLEKLDYLETLERISGVDFMEDNCRECIKRLYMCEESQIRELGPEGCAEQFPDYQWSPGLKEIYVVDAEHYRGIANIVCADGLKYDYRFGEPLSDEEKIKLFTQELGIKRNKKNRIDPEVIGLFGF